MGISTKIYTYIKIFYHPAQLCRGVKNPTLTNPYVDYSLRCLKVFIFLEILVSYNGENYKKGLYGRPKGQRGFY
jgi:hypothetical protein